VPDERDVPIAPLIRVHDETEILTLARQVARRSGDPNPELIQHAAGTRETATRATGSIVFSDALSYIIVIKGHFRARRAAPPGRRYPEAEAFVEYPIQVLVTDIASGQVTDSGSTFDYPDLASVGAVITDHRTRE
jgi:hypothetical protein